MYRWMLLLLAILSFIGASLSIWAAWPRPEPDLWTESLVFDHGNLFQGQEARAEFEFVNHFPDPVEITEVMKSCTCTEAAFTFKQLQPGQHTCLKVVWKTGRMRGNQSIHVGVIYRLANGSVGTKSLRIDANVVPDIACEPEKLVFDGNKPETLTVRLKPARMTRFNASKATSNHAAFKAELRGNDVVEVAFDGKTPVYANGLEPRLTIQTDSANEPQLVLRLELRAPLPTQ